MSGPFSPLNMPPTVHPLSALFDSEPAVPSLPVCDHYAGSEDRMRKSIALQAELAQEFGRSVFDVTLDGEDGATLGGELEHAELMASLVMTAPGPGDRIGARVHPVRHAAFEAEVDLLLRRCGTRLAYLMVPKPESFDDIRRACEFIDHTARAIGLARTVPIHTLIETHGALRDVHAIASHPRIESLSFGLMDFVSAHRGAIPASAMQADGQFSHPLVLRAKLEIAAAAHAAFKVPSHCVVTEFADTDALRAAAGKARHLLGYARMWSIHPQQIRPIIDAFAPANDEVELAAELLLQAQAAHWGPIRFKAGNTVALHDRASYRYFWHVLSMAAATGRAIPGAAAAAFFATSQTSAPSRPPTMSGP